MRSRRRDTFVSLSSLGKSRNASQKVKTRTRWTEKNRDYDMCGERKIYAIEFSLWFLMFHAWIERCTFSDECNINFSFYHAADNSYFVRAGYQISTYRVLIATRFGHWESLSLGMASLFTCLLVILALGVGLVKGDGKQNKTYGRFGMFSTVLWFKAMFKISPMLVDSNQWKALYLFVKRYAAHLDLLSKARAEKTIVVSTWLNYRRFIRRNSTKRSRT